MSTVSPDVQGLQQSPDALPPAGPPDIEAALAQVSEQAGNKMKGVAGQEMADVPSSFEVQREAGAPLEMPNRVQTGVTHPIVSEPVPFKETGMQSTLHTDIHDRISPQTYNAATLGYATASVAPVLAVGGLTTLGAGGATALLSGSPAATAAVTGIGGVATMAGAGLALAPLGVGAGIGALIDRRKPARGAAIGAAIGGVGTSLALGSGLVAPAAFLGAGVLGGVGLNALGRRVGKFMGAKHEGGAFKNIFVRGLGAPLYIPAVGMKNMFSGGFRSVRGG